jgi:protein-tyrosine phosphatase
VDAGVNIPMGLWAIATGGDPGAQPVYRSPYYTRNLEADVEWFKENGAANRADPLLLTRPAGRSLLELLRPLTGRESWDHYDWRDWRVCLTVLARTAAGAGGTAGRYARRRWRLRRFRTRHAQVLERIERRTRGALPRVLFVCFGNICRSAFAEAYTRRVTPEIEVASAGFCEEEQRQSPEWFQRIAAGLGADLSSSRSRRITQSLVEWADVVILSDLANYEHFRREFAGSLDKTTFLGLFAAPPRVEIPDPYVLDVLAARDAAQQVRDAVDAVIAWAGRITSPVAAGSMSRVG